MPRRRGRRLNPLSGHGDGDCYADSDCSWSPLPPIIHSAPAPAPAPAPPPSVRASPEPCPPFPTPSPAPVPTASWGRRDQGPVGRYGFPPGPGGGDGNHNRRLVTSVLAAAAAIAFVSLILLGVSVALRRRQVRRRRQALLAASAAAVPAAPADDDPEGGGGGVVHHVWYIRTVGLDEAAIGSIAATRYRAGAGLLGAADCTVCLGEFQDGELVRLLPKCGHAFHVPCIDTWLRAHVNCPLCRSDVLDPAVATDAAGGGEPSSTPAADPVSDNNAAAAQADLATDAVAEHEQEEDDPHRGAFSSEEDQHVQSSQPEQPPQLPCPLTHNVRRAASMDAATMSTAAGVASAVERLPEVSHPEEDPSVRRKRGGTGPSVVKASGSSLRRNLSTDRPPASVGIPRSFFSRHSRARSSVLPL